MGITRDHAPTMLQAYLDGVSVSPAVRTRIQADILRELLASDASIRMLQDDTDLLEQLFRAYDKHCFDRLLLYSLGNIPLRFRWSDRMTRSAGTTSRFTTRDKRRTLYYEIAISRTLVMANSPQNNPRPISVGGLTCHNPASVLQRIMEHEMVHLAELLAWKKSSCKGKRFQHIAGELFGHSCHTHSLVTLHERAAADYQVQAGARVRFEYGGNHYLGRVNRITKRASVLVESARGQRYSDGKRYQKFYVPLDQLTPVN